MKKISILLILIMVLFTACYRRASENTRINGKVNSVFDGVGFIIIEVDGHEYLTNHRGGIIHLESCSCKKDK